MKISWQPLENYKVKGQGEGLTRAEFEYAIPVGDAEEMLALCKGSLVEKTRYRVPYGAHVWEVDAFHGDNAGLVLAEIELQMPVILSPDDYDRWLDHGVTDPAEVQDLLKPYPGEMQAHPVSSTVNSSRNNSPKLLRAA